MASAARRLTGLLAVLTFALMLDASAGLANARQNVLILYSYNDLIPWQARIHQALQERIEQISPDAKPDIYEERLDSSRIDAAVSGPALADYMRRKYAGLRFDAVIAESSAAARILLDNPELFAEARRYAIDPGFEIAAPTTGIQVILTQGDWARASLLTLAGVLPDLKHLILVTDRTSVGRTNRQKLLAAAAALPKTVSVEVWDDFSFAELADRSRQLPRDSALFYTPVFVDRTGAREMPASVLQNLARQAAAPIFAYHDLYLGKGIVGGRLLSSQRFGAMMADLALGLGDAEHGARTEELLNPMMFDDAQLRRWNIPDRRLPPGSIVVGRVTPAWWRFRWEIGGAAAALLLELGLVLWLIHALRQRDRAVTAVMRERDGLEVRVAERTRALVEAKRRLEISNAHLQDLADTDPLTAVANRRKFLATLDAEWDRAAGGGDLALMMLDIDRFKAINDAHGHVAGDRVIQAFAEICRGRVPLSACLGRLGGEEFAVLLPDAAPAAAVACAERLREAVRSSPVVAADEVGIAVTVSIGVTRRGGPDDTPAALMARADAALYEAKRGGRDRVVWRAEGGAGAAEHRPAVARAS